MRILKLSILLAFAFLITPTFAQVQRYGAGAVSPIGCDNFTPFGNLATATTKELVPLSAGKTIYVCGFDMHATGVTTVTLVYGTGTNCGTGVQNITDDFDFIAADGMVTRGATNQGMKTAISNALCIKNSSTNKVTGGVYWTQF